MNDSVLEQIKLLFRRASCLPPLPATVMNVIHEIDEGDASAKRLEQIISSDPPFVADLLRLANAHEQHDIAEGSLRPLIMRLGVRAVRSFAMSTVLQQVLSKAEEMEPMDRYRLSRSAVATAFFSKYAFARLHKTRNIQSRFTADEIYAAGLLSNIGISLLARVSPDSYGRARFHAMRAKLPFEEAFKRLVGADLPSLTASACEAWNFPPVYTEIMNGLGAPWKSEKEFSAVCCVSYGRYLAWKAGCSFEAWELNMEPMLEVEAEAGMPDEEFQVVCPIILTNTDFVIGLGNSQPSDAASQYPEVA